MLSYDALRQQVSIDPSQLDIACAHQPSLFMDVMDLASDAKAEAKSAKYAWERTQAQIIMDYRTGVLPTDVKLTETSVLSLATAHQVVIDAKEKQLAAEKHSSKCEGLIGAYDHRRSMLTNEVTLYSAGYYHNCDVKPRNTATNYKSLDEVEELQKEITAKRGTDGIQRRRS